MLKFWYDTMMLSVEAHRVIQLRMMKLAMGGPSAQAESHRMVTEKIAASIGAAATLLRGGSSQSVLTQYRRKVRSNSRRLSRE